MIIPCGDEGKSIKNLSKIVVIPWHGAKKPTVYHVQTSIEEAIASSKAVVSPQNAKHGACTTIEGETDRTLLSQWIKYHKLVGIRSFCI